MTPQLKAEYSTKRPYKDYAVTVKGQSFDLPIHGTPDKPMLTKIEFVIEDVVLPNTIYFMPEMNEFDLKKEVENFANNLNKVFSL